MGACTSHPTNTTLAIHVQSTKPQSKPASKSASKRTTPVHTSADTNTSSHQSLQPTNTASHNSLHPSPLSSQINHSTTAYTPNTANVILNNKYELLPGLLGKGHFAKVKRCVDLRTGTHYAIKIIDKKELLKSSTVVKQEIDILKQVGQHRHIVALVDSFENAKHFFLVIELCQGGDLFSKIIEIGKFTEHQASHVCNQLATALQYIHSKNVVHRDLKPENILLTNADNTDEFEIKIADFGLAKLMKNQLNTMKTVCGTWAYCAPEVVTRHPYTSQVDNWTLGVLMYILLSGYHPFDVYGELSEPELLQRIIAVQYDFDDPVWASVSDEAKQLIKKLLIFEPEKRLSLAEYLQSPWVSHSVGAKTETSTAINVVERLSTLAVGKTGLRALVLAKLASQKFKASVNSRNKDEDGNMFTGINSITRKNDLKANTVQINSKVVG